MSWDSGTLWIVIKTPLFWSTNSSISKTPYKTQSRVKGISDKNYPRIIPIYKLLLLKRKTKWTAFPTGNWRNAAQLKAGSPWWCFPFEWTNRFEFPSWNTLMESVFCFIASTEQHTVLQLGNLHKRLPLYCKIYGDMLKGLWSLQLT